MKRTTVLRSVASLGLAAAAAGTLVAVSATGSAAAPVQGEAAARAATVQYQDVEVAKADGYIPVSPCEELPGVGAMGYHYLNPELASDDKIVPTKPELLLYVPDGDGLRLAGVEYFMAEAVAKKRPTVFGRPFDGPMDGHSPEMPRHFDLHFWVWDENPAGITAPWNPALSCDGGAQ
jgi:hypothetical protein